MSENIRVGMVGLGYVGLPVAVAFSSKFPTIGFDLKSALVAELQNGIDPNNEVTPEELQSKNLQFTDRVSALNGCNFYIVAVPTPINQSNHPDLRHLVSASESIGTVLALGDIVVFESTVYPGATEEVCIPALEKSSGLKSGRDFFVGYSPERISPGDRTRSFKTITKIVSGQDTATCKRIAETYQQILSADVFEATSIKVAEAAKVIENTQRDLNIALVNELSLIFSRLNIDTHDVLDAAATKWNFHDYRPGLVGGHCISVDPYYLTYKAEQAGYFPQVILAGRRINNEFGKTLARRLVKELIHAGKVVQDSIVTIFGITFKENCSDIRNTKVVDIINELKEYEIYVQVCDPLASKEAVLKEYGIELIDAENLRPADGLVAAVAHEYFCSLSAHEIRQHLKPNPVIVDVKAMFGDDIRHEPDIRYWRL